MGKIQFKTIVFLNQNLLRKNFTSYLSLSMDEEKDMQEENNGAHLERPWASQKSCLTGLSVRGRETDTSYDTHMRMDSEMRMIHF